MGIESLGGQLILAAIPPFKEEIANLTKYLIHQIEKLGVRVERGCEVNPECVASLKPDAIIVEQGQRPSYQRFQA